ncbi:NDUFA3 isoform 5 [Pongo abelii]|uniref:NADH dehydrogenase [ubiquinone] 1 alpha subcomplex subunit 3 n=1 Tax=Pongo abelii TaxID=9601 RepID=A0A2J8XRA7_PONAB|nr:NDUFA3 isoform 5 [Pongo abelii]
MAARVGAFLRNTWDKEPVLVVSFVIGGLAVILPPLSPYFKYSIMINKATPYNYPAAGEKGHRIELSSHSTQRQSRPGPRRS